MIKMIGKVLLLVCQIRLFLKIEKNIVNISK
jgi:hypothetical protein